MEINRDPFADTNTFACGTTKIRSTYNYQSLLFIYEVSLNNSLNKHQNN